MNDEDKTVAIVQAVITMGEKAFSSEEIKAFIDNRKAEGKLSEEKARELVLLVEERDKVSNEEKDERVSGVISLLLSVGDEEFTDQEIKDFIAFLVEKGSLNKQKGDKFMAEIEKKADPARLEKLRSELQ